MMNFYKSVAIAAIVAVCVSYPAFAQTMTPEPARIAEVDQRLAHVQAEVTSAENSGQLHPRQAARDQEHLTRLSQELQTDEAANGGHISRHEQIKLNHQLDHIEAHIQRQISGLSANAPVAPAATMVPPSGNGAPPSSGPAQ